MWLVTASGEEGRGGVFLQPEVRRRRSRAADVCAMRFLQRVLLSSTAGASVPLRAGFWGRRGARARDFAAMVLASRVAACKADDFTVRRGATRPVAPWRASAIAAHFILL